MVVAVTGSSGFIGKHLCDFINKNYKEIKVIKISSKTGIDITNDYNYDSIDKFDCLIHLAAKNYVPASYEKPKDFYYTNIIGTLNMLELCRKYKAKMIFISSYIYGTPKYLPIDEKHPVKAFNPYAQSKLIGENLCESYHRDFNLPIIILRPFNIYGIGQNPQFLISSIFSQILHGDKIVKLGNPFPRRDFVYIYDVLNAIIKAIKYENNKYDIFNICSGVSYSILEITEIINNEFNNTIKFEFNDKFRRKNEINDTIGDNFKIKKALNWTPKFDFKAGIRDMTMRLKKYLKR